ncbi:MAG: glycosyltransferase family 39 protein [Polyangiales bacterium]
MRSPSSSPKIPWRDARVRLLFAGLFVTYAYFFQGGGWNQNTRFALTRAIVEHRTLRIDETARGGDRLITGDYAERGGHYYSDKAPGSSLTAVPAVALASYGTSSPPTPGEVTFLGYVATLATSALPTALAALLLFACAQALGAGPAGALLATGVFALGSPAFAYATLMWGSALATASLLGAFTAALALRERDDDEQRDGRLGLFVGLAGGWATVTEYPAAVPAAMISLLALAHVWSDPLRRRRVAMGVAAGAAVTAAALAMYNSAAFGSAFTLGYSKIRGFAGMQQGIFGVTRPRSEALWGILFGSYRGIARLAPALLLGPLGLWLLGRRPGHRGAGVTAAAIAAYYVLLNASYAYWDGGWSYGPRHMAPAIPFLALGLAPLWDRASADQRRGITALSLWGVVLAFVAVSTTAQPPETVRAPVSDLFWPAFSRGDLSLNHQSLLQPETVSTRDAANHAWNLGERVGLTGLFSLAPLLLVWAYIASAWRSVGRAPIRPAAARVAPPERPARTNATAGPRGEDGEAPRWLDALQRWLTPRRASLVALGALAAWCALAVLSARGDSPTVDEFVYPPEGIYYLRTGDFRFNPQNPPLIKLLSGALMLARGATVDLSAQWRTGLGGWEPWVFSTRFMLDNRGAYQSMFVEARLIPIALGALLGWFVFVWARELWGSLGGVVAVLAYVACPTILAHARLVTPDLPVTCFMFLSSYALWRWTEGPSRGLAVAFGACVGLSFAAKFSAVLLAPVLAAQLWATRAALRARVASLGPRGVGAHLALATVVAVLALDLCFGFRGLFARLGDLRFASGTFRGVASALPWLRLPLPDALLLGIDAKTADAARGEFSAGFLFGQWSNQGWRSFYLVSLLTKTPLGLLGLAGVSIALWRKGERDTQLPAALTLAAPAVAFVALSTLLFYRVNYGVRYLLPLFPALYVLCGRAAALATRAPWVAPTSAAMLGWALISSWGTHPSYLPYANEVLGGPELAYEAFVDSNVDWGQDLQRLAAWTRERRVESVHLAYFGHVDPSIYGLRYTPLRAGDRPRGVVAVSASQLQGIAYPSTYEQPGRVVPVGRDDFAWLRARRATAVIGHSIFVYDLRGER